MCFIFINKNKFMKLIFPFLHIFDGLVITFVVNFLRGNLYGREKIKTKL